MDIFYLIPCLFHKGQVKNNEAKVWQYGHETWKINFPFDALASFFPMRATMAQIEQYISIWYIGRYISVVLLTNTDISVLPI